MILVDNGKEYKSINIKHCRGLVIQIESLNVRTDVIQCYKCQMFEYIQKNCHAKYKWMKFEHSTHECKKPATTPPKCIPFPFQESADQPKPFKKKKEEKEARRKKRMKQKEERRKEESMDKERTGQRREKMEKEAAKKSFQKH